MYKYISTFWRYRNLLNELVKRDIKLKYRRSVLGVIWSILNPLLMMTVLNIVFSKLFRFEIKNYVIYLITGQIVFSFFSEATNRSMLSIIENASLIKKIYIPKYILPLARVLSSLVNFAFSFLAVLIMMILTGMPFTWTLLLMPLSVLYIFLFTLGIGLIFASYAIFFRDLIHLHGIVVAVWMYLTPIIYPASIVPDNYKFILEWNPLYYFVQHFRTIVMEGQVPSLELNAVCFAVSSIAIVLGLYLFYRKQDEFILYV